QSLILVGPAVVEGERDDRLAVCRRSARRRRPRAGACRRQREEGERERCGGGQARTRRQASARPCKKWKPRVSGEGQRPQHLRQPRTSRLGFNWTKGQGLSRL